MITDLTVGPPAKILWRFSLPLLLSVVFQQLYNVADSVIAGNFISSNALAAVGTSYPITMIFMAIAIGTNAGCSVVVSQFFGAKNYRDMKTAVFTTIISAAVLSIALTAAGLLLCSRLLHLISTPQELFADARLYLNIYILGFGFVFLYNIANGVFTALGDSKTPLYFLIFSSLLNIALDVLFVTAFSWGVAGIAWATFTAQGIAAVLSLVVMLRRVRTIRTAQKPAVFSGKILGRISIIAVPSILQQSFVSVGQLFIQGLVNSFGADVIAGYSAALKLSTFGITVFTAFASGISTYSAHNMGAGRLDRIKQGAKAALLMAVFISLPFILMYTLFGGPMVALFLGDNATAPVLAVGRQFLLIVSPFYYIIFIKILLDNVLKGMGAVLPFTVSTFADLILRVFFAYLLAARFGANGIWASWPVGWCIGTGLAVLFYYRIVGRKTALPLVKSKHV